MEKMTEESEHDRFEERCSRAFMRIQQGIETWLLVWLVRMDMRVIFVIIN